MKSGRDLKTEKWREAGVWQDFGAALMWSGDRGANRRP